MILNGNEITGVGKGALCIKIATPGIARTSYGDHDRYPQTYFSSFKGYYFSGDAARRDEYGYIWIEERMDDVIGLMSPSIWMATQRLKQR